MRHLQALGDPQANQSKPYVFNESILNDAVKEFVRVFNETPKGEGEKIGVAFDKLMATAGLDRIRDVGVMEYMAAASMSATGQEESEIAKIHRALQYVSDEVKKALPDVFKKVKEEKGKDIEAKVQQLFARNGTLGELYAINKQTMIDEKNVQGMSTAKKVMIFGGGALAIGGIIYYFAKRSSK